MPCLANIAFASSLNLPNLMSISLHTFCIVKYWSLNSCISWNFSFYSVISFIIAIALLCHTSLLLAPPVYTSFFISASKPIESRVISRSLSSGLDSTWCFVLESHSDISTAKRFHRFPSSTCLVFIISVILKSQILFSCAVCLPARLGYGVQIIFPWLRHIFMLDPFLSCVLMNRPSLSLVLKYSSGPSFHMENPTPWKTSSAVDCCHFPVFLLPPPVFLKCGFPSQCSPPLPLTSASFIVGGNF